MDISFGMPTIGARELQHCLDYSGILFSQNWTGIGLWTLWFKWIYTSNFIRSFGDGNELLVEIKGMMNIWNTQDEC